MLKTPQDAWAIVDAMSGQLVLFDGRCPIYWLRKVAMAAAQERGLVTSGLNPDVRICRVGISQYRKAR